MSVLRKEEPIITADSANQRRASRNTGNTVIDPADRRPPQSAAVTSDTSNVDIANRDDTYDGEIVNSGTGPAFQNDDGRPVSEPAYRTIPTVAPSRPASSVPHTADGRNNPNDGPLFQEDELRDFRARWDQVQTSFVDEPRHAVEQADTLVATVVKHIAEQFAEERAKLEKQWDRGEDVSTEDLRQGFKRYRAFFDRLLAF